MNIGGNIATKMLLILRFKMVFIAASAKYEGGCRATEQIIGYVQASGTATL